MKRVLLISPHFPPDTGAASHRMRLLAPHLPRHGWEPVVVAADAQDLEQRVEPALLDFVPRDLQVIRVRAMGRERGRFLGVGDLGLRLMPALRRVCNALLGDGRFQAVVVTMPPHYPAALTPWIRRRFGVPVVLDFQDPWVSAWGLTAGPAPDGSPDMKSRLSRKLALALEPRAVAAASGLAAVSEGTLRGVFERSPDAASLPRAAVPLGGDPGDFERVRALGRRPPGFDPRDGRVHLVYVGTLLPLGFETLRALLEALARVRREDPGLGGRIRLHFYGTSNRLEGDPEHRVLAPAREAGVEDLVEEVPLRIDYMEALSVLASASGILLLGSSESHYTASKIYPALLARRPLLALYHEASTVVPTLRGIGRPPTVRVVDYGEEERAGSRVPAVAEALAALAANPVYRPEDIEEGALGVVQARNQAGVLADLLDRVVAREGPARA